MDDLIRIILPPDYEIEEENEENSWNIYIFLIKYYIKFKNLINLKNMFKVLIVKPN